MSVLVVGSVALDTVETPAGRVTEAVGGSATYFSLAASLYGPVRLVAVVGDDFPQRGLTMLRERRVDLRGLEIVPGRTFRWVGRYGDDLNSAETLETQLNVFAQFDPKIPADFRDTPVLFLANIDPELQLRVVKEIRGARFTAMDTMNFWIASKRDVVTEVMSSVDVVLVNEAELRQYAQNRNLTAAARQVLDLGPRAVVVKKGEYGCAVYAQDGYFAVPAYPSEQVCDPTGAGDSFAGAFIGSLANSPDWSWRAIRRAVLHGSVVASFTIESFSVDRVVALQPEEVDRRLRELVSFTQIEPEWEKGLIDAHQYTAQARR
ncbi:MAG TPA: PfkB family carbohydrate kinase [Chloroflexota bacterium]|nr:PfkB family carbohydrate kinase [Chloroflexota bacterium]